MLKVNDEVRLKLHLYEKGHSQWLVVTHGLGEYSLRHKHLIDSFSQKFNICFYDLRGHGQSDGERACSEDFSLFAQDLKLLVNYLRDNYLMKDYKLFGHSMGGLITADFMQNYVDPTFYPKAVFLSSPVVAPTGILGSVLASERIGITNFLLKMPKMKLEGLLDIKKLSHDMRIYNDYIEDPLNSLKLSTKLLFLLIERTKVVYSEKLNINCPLYVVIGSEDVLVNPKACIDYYTHIESNATLEVIEGAYHEIHNEIKRYYDPYLAFLKSSLLND